MTETPSFSACVYLDTVALKLSIREVHGYTSVEEVVNWGERELAVTSHKPTVAHPIERISNPELVLEANLLPRIAALANEGLIELVIQNETLVEFSGLPRAAGRPFFGAPLRHVSAPFEYGRVVYSSSADSDKLQYDFIAGINAPRFIELQKACGAYQGDVPPPRNQLLDAFHVWCAEAAGCTQFLTCDMSLVRYVQRQKRYVPTVQVVLPSQLLTVLAQ